MYDIYFDRKGRRITQLEYMRLFKDKDYQHIKQWYIPRRNAPTVMVSTIWLGMDHGFGRHDKPVIFETGVFEVSKDGQRIGTELEMYRYDSEEEALREHDVIVLRYVNQELPFLFRWQEWVSKKVRDKIRRKS